MTINVPSLQDCVNTKFFKNSIDIYLIYYMIFIQKCVDTKSKTNNPTNMLINVPSLQSCVNTKFFKNL
jgi:hypothetical protein